MNVDRKGIRQRLGNTLEQLRCKQNLQRNVEDEALNKLSISKKTISRIEKGITGTSFENVVLLMNLYNGKPEDIMRLFDSPYEDNVDQSYDYTSTHKKRLLQYSKMNYYCYYIGTVDSEPKEVEALLIHTETKIKDGFLSATAEHSKYDYSVKIVSPADYNFTFIYFTSIGTLKDKGVIVLPFLRDIKKKFTLGIGVMLSLSMDNTPIPCFQKVLVVSADYHQEERKEIVSTYGHEYLTFRNNNDKMSDYGIKALTLEQQTRKLYDQYKKAKKNSKRK